MGSEMCIRDRYKRLRPAEGRSGVPDQGIRAGPPGKGGGRAHGRAPEVQDLCDHKAVCRGGCKGEAGSGKSG